MRPPCGVLKKTFTPQRGSALATLDLSRGRESSRVSRGSMRCWSLKDLERRKKKPRLAGALKPLHFFFPSTGIVFPDFGGWFQKSK